MAGKVLKPFKTPSQVVLLGWGHSQRAFQLPWPVGTILYHVADEKSHVEATSTQQALGLRVPRGCLLKRVVAT